MVNIVPTTHFKKLFSKVKNPVLKKKVLKQIEKLGETPEQGKPMKYSRKNTRELYIKPYRLSYEYKKEENTIILLDLHHKDEQ